MKDIAKHKSWVKLEFPKWVATVLCEPITKLFTLVAREGFPGFMDCQHHSKGFEAM